MHGDDFALVHSYNKAGTQIIPKIDTLLLTTVAFPCSCSTTFRSFISSRRHCHYFDLSQADWASCPEFVLSIIIPCVIAEFAFKLHGGFG
jgi:hypothetical protein